MGYFKCTSNWHFAHMHLLFKVKKSIFLVAFIFKSCVCNIRTLQSRRYVSSHGQTKCSVYEKGAFECNVIIVRVYVLKKKSVCLYKIVHIV